MQASTHHVLLIPCALFMAHLVGCNFKDSATTQAECASSQECEATQLCTIDGECVDLPSSLDMDEPKVIVDMSPSHEDMRPDLAQATQDSGVDMSVADQAPDMVVMIDMPDMTLVEDMTTMRLSPSQTSYAASGSFTFRAAASGESGELSLVGELASMLSVPTQQGVFMHQKMGGASTGFQIQGAHNIALLDVTQRDQQVMAVGTTVQTEDGIPNGLWASFDTRNGEMEYGRHYNRNKEEVYTHVVAAFDKQWVIAGATGANRDRFFVAHVQDNGDVIRAEALSPPDTGVQPTPLRVMALRMTDNHAYVMTQRDDSSKQSTLLTRFKMPTLDFEWSVEVSGGVRLYDMVISGDKLYAVGHVHDSNEGISAVFDSDSGALLTSARYQDIQLRALTREDDSTLWALGTSTSSPDTIAAYRVDPLNPVSTGVELSPATLSDAHAASLIVTQGHMTAFAAKKTGFDVTLYPMNDAPIATCALAPFGAPRTIIASPQSITVDSINLVQDNFELEDDMIEGANLVGFSPSATSPICR